MNPLVEKMLNTTVSNDVETRFLEDLFEHDCKCESAHRSENNRYCVGNVSHILLTCTPAQKVCDAQAQYTKTAIWEYGWTRCEDCDLTVRECWTIRPI